MKRQRKALPRRKPRKLIPVRKRPASTAGLRKALAAQKKGDLVELLLELAQADRELLRRLNARFDVPATPDELEAVTRQAISDATDFDERDANYNFDYDSAAYEEVKRSFRRLIDSGELRLAMKLSLELMKQGSYQVETSDEGLMTPEIEDCLGVVFKALKNCDLPAGEVVAWCSEMLASDRVGFIADKQLESLRSRFQAATGR